MFHHFSSVNDSKRSKDGGGDFVCHTTHTLHGSGDSYVTHMGMATFYVTVWKLWGTGIKKTLSD